MIPLVDRTAAEHVMARRLAKDLETQLDAYGVDCRGLGYGAVASALLAAGWRRGSVLTVDDVKSPGPASTSGTHRPRIGAPARALAEKLAAERGWTLEQMQYAVGKDARAFRIRAAHALVEFGCSLAEAGELIGRSRGWVSRAMWTWDRGDA